MNLNKNRLIFLLTTLVLIIAISFLVYQKEHKKLALTTQKVTVKNIIKATPLNYAGSTLLNEFNKTTIENYPTAAGTYDLATMASEITSQMLQAFSATGIKTLPLVANWNVGIPEYSDGLDPLYVINRLTNGEHIVPTWKLDPYYNDSIGLSYYETSIKKAAELGLPLVFTLPSPESALTKDDVYFTMDKTNNPNVITPKGLVLPKLSPFGPNSLWNEVGKQWSTTSLMAQLQEWYPNPPLIIFIDEDSASKLSWSELNSSSRYQTQYPSDGTDEFKRTLVNAQWVEKYRQLHQGFVQGFTSDAWKKNAKFITRNQLAINMGTTNDWQSSATTTNLHANIWPLTADGLTINFSLDGNKSLLNNLPFMLDEAKESNANFVSQLSIDASQQITDLNIYRGYTQLALWLLRPNIIRQTSNGTTKADINPLFQQVVDSVELINNNDILADFWKNGKLVPAGDSNYNLNIPTKYQTAPRDFFLKTDATTPVYTFIFEKGIAPQRQWLLYIQSPNTTFNNVILQIPNYKNILVNSSMNGNFYIIDEVEQNTNLITLTDSKMIGASVTQLSFKVPKTYANILNYGGIGDGITDNTQAFKDALAANANIYVPNGIFKISGRIHILDTTKTFFGEGTITSDTEYEHLITSSYNKNIDGLIINGLTLFGTIYFNDIKVKNLTIQNCIFRGRDKYMTNGIAIVGKKQESIKNILIINNYFIDIPRFPIEIINRASETDLYIPNIIFNVIVKNNTISRRSDFSQAVPNRAASGISFGGRIENGLIDKNYINGLPTGIEISMGTTVTNNIVTNANYIFMGTTGWKDMIIKNNYFQNNIVGGWSPASDEEYPSNILYSNNIDIGLVKFRHSKNVLIENNHFYAPHNQPNAIQITDCDEVVFKNNYIENNNTTVHSAIQIGGKRSGKITTENNIIFIPNDTFIPVEQKLSFPDNGIINNYNNQNTTLEIPAPKF